MNTPRPPWRSLYDKIAPVLALLCLVIALGAAVGTYVNDRAVDRSNAKRIADNEANAVTSCENANETRAASRALWNYVLDLAAAGNPDATPAETAQLADFRGYVGAVYAERDCSDLSKKYPLPPPPDIPTS